MAKLVDVIVDTYVAVVDAYVVVVHAEDAAVRQIVVVDGVELGKD